MSLANIFLIFGIPAIMIFFIVLCILGYRKTGKQIACLQYLCEEIVIVGSENQFRKSFGKM